MDSFSAHPRRTGKHEAEDDTHVFTLSQVDEGLLLKMGEKVIDIFGNDTMTLMPVTAG